MLNDYRLPPLNGSAAQRAVVFLHGLGDRGDGGLLSIGQAWQRTLPDTEFLCPDAPFAYDMAPPDFGGRQWFSLQNLAPERLEAGVCDAAPILNDYIDHVLETRNLPPERLALVGFSQGTMMALYIGPRRAKPVAAIVGYSGLLRGADRLAKELRSNPPVLLVHGTHDEVVPYPCMAQAEEALQKVGIPVSSITCPGLGHNIDEVGVREGVKFLQKYF